MCLFLALLWLLSSVGHGLCQPPIHPPRGAEYVKTVAFPLLRCRQRVHLRVLDDKRAMLSLAGIIEHAETLAFRVQAEQRIEFELSDALTAIMRRYGARMVDARYDAVEDVAVVRVRIGLLRLVVPIRMPRYDQIA